jgi:hypothetical protein
MNRKGTQTDRKGRRSFSRDREGAAEIIGDILLVAMSVIMVSALALQLSTVQNPTDSVRVDLGASYDGQNITILHMGGEPLDNVSTHFQLFINDSIVRGANITDGKTGTRWHVGERWVLSFPTNMDQKLTVQVIDTKNHAVILDQVLQRGPDALPVPDLGLTVNDIALRYNGQPFNDTNAPMATETISVGVTVHNYGAAPAYNFTVRVSDYSTLKWTSWGVLATNLSLNATSAQTLTAGYIIPTGSWGMHTLTVRIVPLPNETMFGNNYASVEFRVGYGTIASSPGNPVLRIRTVEAFPQFPVHGAYVNLTARISNQGGVPASATVSYYFETVSPANLIGQETGIGVPVGGEALSTIVWKTLNGGVHNIIVNATDPSGSTDQQVLQVDILPTILLVDDSLAGAGSVRDVVTPMESALDACAASYTLHTVAGGTDGPLYDGGDHPLRDYDLVIWMTGYEPGSTMTANDESQLERYLYESHGRLWLIGQDILSGNGAADPLLKDALMVSPSTPGVYMDAGLGGKLSGSEILPGVELPVNDPFPTGLLDRADQILLSPPDLGVAAFNNSGGEPVGILFNATTNGTYPADTYQSAFFSFEPSQIVSANDRSIMTYEMLRWFGMAVAWGRDLAVSDQTFSKAAPSFMETVNITVWVRNNGLNDEPIDVSRPVLQLGFYVDGVMFDPKQVAIEDAGGALTIFDPPTSEIWIPQDTGNASMKVPGKGGFIKVSMLWTADKIGLHTIVGRVDPYDNIQEINEYNNEVSSTALTDIYVRYGTLVVDDDGSANNGGAGYPATDNVTAALDQLGYTYDQFNATGAGDGPGIAKMELYNAIIWCTGESAGALTALDKANLMVFLNKGDGRYLWLIGPRAVPNGDYSGGSDTFYRDYLRVARVVTPASTPYTPAYIEGANLDAVAHGVRYPATPTYPDGGHILVPYNDGQGMLYQSPMPTTSTPNEVVYCDAQDGTVNGWYARIIPPTTTSNISNVYDAQRGGQVIQLTRSGSQPADSFFILGDYSLSSDQNPNSLPWREISRSTAQWSFKFAISYTFVWHVTDTTGAHHTLTYVNSDLNNLAAEPVQHGLGAATADGRWHTVTRDLQLDLREGAGNGGLTIRQVDGFEVAMNVGSGLVDNITASRPFMAIRNDNVTGNYRTVYSTLDQSFISYTDNTDYSAEMTYLVMRWFNMYDTRPELRVTHLDLFHTTLLPLRDMKPMMGESYMLKARVWNPGGARADAVVRFSDGATVIASVSVSVEHDSFVLAEVVWTPLYAGSRTISVWVDPDNMLGELFKFNNRANITIQVYFFYDDMEGGISKWDHEATTVRINGESSLEYMDPGPVNSNVIGQWGDYNGFRNNTDNMSLANITSQYHSQGSSVYMHEPKLESRTPVDVILTMDATGSMEDETPGKAEGAKNGMFQFIDQLQPQDRGAIAAFTTSYPLNSNPNPPLVPFYTRLYAPLTSDKGALSDGIANITVGGATPFWNAVVVSFTYVLNYGDTTHVRCVVILTDGMSNSDRPSIAAGHATALATVTTAPIPVFIIGYGSGIHPSVAENDMIALAAQANMTGGGGGWYYFAPHADEIQWVFANISKKIAELSQTIGRGADASTDPTIPTTDSTAREDSGRIVLFNDNMEGGVGGWTTRDYSGAGTVWHYQNNDFRNSGYHSWRDYNSGTGTYNANNDDWLISPTFDAYGYHNLQLSFWHRPALYRGNGYDFGYVFLSYDNGATWVGVQALSNDIEYSNTATGVTVTGVGLNVLPATSQMKVAFRMWTDGVQNTGQGWSVDDVLVTGDLGFGRSVEGEPAGLATVTIMREGFESATPAWTANSIGGAGTWQRDTTRFHTDLYGYRCFGAGNHFYVNDNDTLDSPTFDLSGGYTNPLLTFWDRQTMNNGDNLYVYVSNDNGATWTQIWNDNTRNDAWAQQGPFDLTNSGTVTLTSQMKIRFRFAAANIATDTGWSIDDILITADTPAAGSQSGTTITASWNDGSEVPTDKSVTTPTFSLQGVSSAMLTFWHKYDLKVGSNGGVLQVGIGSNSTGPFTYYYLAPTQPYPSNLRISDWGSAHLKDGNGTDMRWCWNGVSGAGKFTWDYVQADLTPYVGNAFVRIKFLYLFCAGGTGFGWAIDDVEVRVHRSDSVAVTSAIDDQWELVKEGNTYGDDYADGRFAYSGQYSWWSHNPQAGIDTLKGGIDSGLISIPIDLSRAKDAFLQAKLRFNLPYPEGRPPDGFRVEVSNNNGISWRQINMGVRAAWNVSGTETAGTDGTSYTGVDLGDNWVNSGTLTRLNCDLSGWAGSVIQIRFRVVTRNDTPMHYHDLGAGFGGFFIDDVTVVGNTTTGQGRSVEETGTPGQGPGAGGENGGAGRGERGAVDGASPHETPSDAKDASRGGEMRASGQVATVERSADRRGLGLRRGDCWIPTE